MEDLKERYLQAKRRLFDVVYGQRLNDKQREAVFCAEGPLLVLAGAGSGKTTVLVNRIGYLIKYGNAYHAPTVPEGVSEGMVQALEELADAPAEEIEQVLPEFISDPCPPWNVLAFTFTNKAAGEIRARLAVTLSDSSMADAVWAGTFHSTCVRILRRFGDRLGYRDGFSIYDADDQRRTVTAVMKDLGIDEDDLNPKTVTQGMANAKNTLIPPSDYKLGRDVRDADVKRVYEEYQNRLMKYNALDFDDLIMQTVRLLQTEPDVLAYYQNKFRYVLVDEYQDTNYAQFVLTKLLAGGRNNLMVVGDDDQSIYKFRGATVENILNFDKVYPDARVVKIEQNYRSTQIILDAANAVISHNDARREKRLWCERGAGERITVYEAPDNIAEGRYIIEKINRAVRTEGAKYSDFAVLYRINDMARSLETTFSKSGVPYRVVGAQRFADRKEIKDMVAYLCLVLSGDDDMRLKRVINEPKRKIGAATVEAVEQIARAEGLSMYRVMERAGEYVALSKTADKLQTFVHIIDEIRAKNLTPSALIPEIFEKTGYRAMLEAGGKHEDEMRIQSVEEFVSAAVEYEQNCARAETEATLAGFLEDMALVSDVDKYDDKADAVVLMTVHSAKGLEFPTVFIAGMEDGIFPSERNFGDPDEMSEERRLCYVAITRAKNRLYMTYCRERLLYGKTAYGSLSAFVKREIPGSLLQSEKEKTEPARPANAFRPYVSPVRAKEPVSREFYRSPAVGNTPFRRPEPEARRGAGQFGIEKFAPGTRVRHAVFGEGTVLSAKDMGGDVLYSVAFDSGEKKSLMATYARLEKIEKA